MSNRLIFLPTYTKKSDVTFHKKSEFPNIEFNFKESIQYSYIFKETPNSNLHQISLISEYTFTTKDTEYFCRLDIHSPFEINKYVIDLTREDFERLSKTHMQNCKEEFNLSNINFPDSFTTTAENENVNEEHIALMLIDFRNIQNSLNN